MSTGHARIDTRVSGIRDLCWKVSYVGGDVPSAIRLSVCLSVPLFIFVNTDNVITTLPTVGINKFIDEVQKTEPVVQAEQLH